MHDVHDVCVCDCVVYTATARCTRYVQNTTSGAVHLCITCCTHSPNDMPYVRHVGNVIAPYHSRCVHRNFRIQQIIHQRAAVRTSTHQPRHTAAAKPDIALIRAARIHPRYFAILCSAHASCVHIVDMRSYIQLVYAAQHCITIMPR